MKFEDLKRQGLLSKANTELSISYKDQLRGPLDYIRDVVTFLTTPEGRNVVSLHISDISDNALMKEWLEQLASNKTSLKALTITNCASSLIFSDDALQKVLVGSMQLNNVKILAHELPRNFHEHIERNKNELEKTLKNLLDILTNNWKGHIDLSGYPLNQLFLKGLKQAVENNRHLTVTLHAPCNLTSVFWKDKASFKNFDRDDVVPEFDKEDGIYLIDEINKLSNENRERAEFEKKYREKYEVKTLLKPKVNRPLEVGATTPSTASDPREPSNKRMRAELHLYTGPK